MTIQSCPHCQTEVIVTPDGRCPSCRQLIADREHATDAPQIDLNTSQKDENPYRSPRTASPTQRSQVRVKAYGLVPMTRRTYLTLQVVVTIAAVALILVLKPLLASPGNPLGFLSDYLIPGILVVLALEAIETIWMLEKFRQAERKQAERDAK